MKNEEWVPYSEAAKKLGVSKQALYDRIKRGTLPSKTNHPRGDLFGKKSVLVRIQDCKKKQKAGRPKGSKKKSLNREGWEIPVYFKLEATFRDGRKETIFEKIHKGCVHRYTDQTFTQLAPMNRHEMEVCSKQLITGTLRSKRANTYCHYHKCNSTEVKPKSYDIKTPWECPHCKFKNHSGYFCEKCDNTRCGAMLNYYRKYRPEMKDKFLDQNTGTSEHQTDIMEFCEGMHVPTKK